MSKKKMILFSTKRLEHLLLMKAIPFVFIFLLHVVIGSTGLRIKKPIIGVLVEYSRSDGGNSTEEITLRCSSVDPDALQEVEAVRWASDVIHSQSHPDEAKIHIRVFDLCQEPITDVVNKITRISLTDLFLGFIALGNSPQIAEASHILRSSSIPLIVASSSLATTFVANDYVFTTAPDPAAEAQAVVAVIHQMGVESVALVASSPHAVRGFAKGAISKGIQVAHVLQGEPGAHSLAKSLHEFLRGEGADCPVIVLILDASEVAHLVKSLTTSGLELPGIRTWVLASMAMDRELLIEWKSSVEGSTVFLEPHMPELKQFRKTFLQKVKNSTEDRNTSLSVWIESLFSCGWESSEEQCSGITESDIQEQFHQDLQVAFVVKAVSAYSAALKIVQLNECQHHLDEKTANKTTKLLGLPACIDVLQKFNTSKLQDAILSELKRFSIPSSSPSDIDRRNKLSVQELSVDDSGPVELEGTTVRIAQDGELVFNKYVIYDVKEGANLTMLGWYSESEGFVLDTMIGITPAGPTSVLESEKSLTYPLSSESLKRDSGWKRYEITSSTKQSNIIRHLPDEVDARLVHTQRPFLNGAYALVLLAFAAIGSFVALYMIVYVLLRLCDGTLQGNQSLGLLLLFSIIVIYGSVLLYLIPTGEVICVLRLFVPNTFIVLSLGILLVKAMQLRSLVLLGLGGRISYINQYVTLCFVVIVQIAMDLQWYVVHAPKDAHLRQDCGCPRIAFLLLHAYAVITGLFVFLYGLGVLKIRRNYHEARWITLAAGFTLPIFLAWGLVHGFAPTHWLDPMACISLILISTIILTIVFLPKMNTISKQSTQMKHKRLKMAAAANGNNSISTVFTTEHNSMTIPSVITTPRIHHGNIKQQMTARESNKQQLSPRNYAIPRQQQFRGLIPCTKFVATRPIALKEPFSRDWQRM